MLCSRKVEIGLSSSVSYMILDRGYYKCVAFYGSARA
jgi:hypothetical protein